jgi:hypothetical protein
MDETMHEIDQFERRLEVKTLQVGMQCRRLLILLLSKMYLRGISSIKSDERES